MAEAANSVLVCKNWRRLIPLELRPLFILVDIFQPTASVDLYCDTRPAPQIGKAFFWFALDFLRPARHVFYGQKGGTHYCLMSDHFHPVLETPQPNLMVGMKWLRGAHTRRHTPFMGPNGKKRSQPRRAKAGLKFGSSLSLGSGKPSPPDQTHRSGNCKTG